jgi:hypothetical protein
MNNKRKMKKKKEKGCCFSLVILKVKARPHRVVFERQILGSVKEVHVRKLS